MKQKVFALLLFVPALLIGCASNNKYPANTPKPEASPVVTAPVNDFPTLTRVEYVLSCMQEKGGKNYDNLYHCVCAIDKIAANMTHDEFLQAETFETNKNLAGERGGVFRDPPQSKALRDKLKTVSDEAIAACFPNGGKVSAPKTK